MNELLEQFRNKASAYVEQFIAETKADLEENPENYDGIDINDVWIWFMESFG